MTESDLGDVLYEQFVQDLAGALSWLDDEYDVDVPSDRETAARLADRLIDPRMVVYQPHVEEADEDLVDIVEESKTLRVQLARGTAIQWFQTLNMPLIPGEGPSPPRMGGPHG